MQYKERKNNYIIIFIFNPRKKIWITYFGLLHFGGQCSWSDGALPACYRTVCGTMTSPAAERGKTGERGQGAGIGRTRRAVRSAPLFGVNRHLLTIRRKKPTALDASADREKIVFYKGSVSCFHVPPSWIRRYGRLSALRLFYYQSHGEKSDFCCVLHGLTRKAFRGLGIQRGLVPDGNELSSVSNGYGSVIEKSIFSKRRRGAQEPYHGLQVMGTVALAPARRLLNTK